MPAENPESILNKITIINPEGFPRGIWDEILKEFEPIIFSEGFLEPVQFCITIQCKQNKEKGYFEGQLK